MFTLAEVQIPRSEIGGNMMIILVVALIVLLRLLVGYMQHKQVMAAIEKGIPLSDFKRHTWKSPNWITSISIGVGMLIIAVGLFCMFWKHPCDTGAFLAAFIFCGIGAFFVIWGLFQRKTQRRIQPSDKTEAGEDKSPAPKSIN